MILSRVAVIFAISIGCKHVAIVFGDRSWRGRCVQPGFCVQHVVVWMVVGHGIACLFGHQNVLSVRDSLLFRCSCISAR